MSKLFKPPYDIIIYCGGKCGGASLHKTFIFMKEHKPIHIHKDADFKGAQILGIHPFEKNNKPKSIFELIDKKKKVYIIDSYRNPRDRKISSYFHNYEHNKKFFNVPKNICIEKEVEYYQMYIENNLENYEAISEPLKHYNINIIDMENKGTHWTYEKDNITFIRLKFEYIKNWNSILSEIMNKKIELRPYNLSNDKEYYQYYQLFRKIYYNKFK